jgi:hypothetical protein
MFPKPADPQERSPQTMNTKTRAVAITRETLELTENQRLIVERRETESVLHVIGSSGQVSLTIQLTAEGPVLRFDGLDLRIEAGGDLAIGARQLRLHGREGVAISSGGDASIRAAGVLDSEATIQNIRARLGNVNVKANDDVGLRGERIRLNC